jgi:quercetin dioxygenase-like cupin family protein
MFDIPAEQTPLTAMTVEVADGARTAWHSHPCGQILIAVSGLGEVQASGGPIVTLRPGDAIWAEPGERHWHGAAAGQDFVYTSIQPADPVTGSFADWED